MSMMIFAWSQDLDQVLRQADSLLLSQIVQLEAQPNFQYESSRLPSDRSGPSLEL